MSIYSTYSQLVKPNKIERDISSDCKVGKFAIYPIQRGFGVTFGNTLRRVMLSSIRGSAIASIRVDGIDHEFSFIPGICQDMVAICLNLRRVVIKSDLESADAKLEVVGPCVVTAGMIDVPEGVNIINKDHVLFEIDTDTKVAMQIKIKSGIGCVFNEINTLDQNLGEINIDCYFSPIKNVSFYVDTARVDQFTDYDKLTVVIETNGAIAPDESLGVAAAIVRDYMRILVNFDESKFAIDKERASNKESDYNLHLLRKTEDLELSVRSANCLSSAGIRYIGDLVQRNESEMLRMPNFGKKSLDELRTILASMNLAFGIDVGQWPPSNMEELTELASRKFDSE